MILEHIRRKWAVGTYVRVLPHILRKLHGKQRRYTHTQVREAIGAGNLNRKYIEYAFAIYVERSHFIGLKKDPAGSGESYDQLRAEIADKYFSGNAQFTALDCLALASTPSFFRSGNAVGDGGLARFGADEGADDGDD